ncbi:hypothetical protein D3C78_1976430 [compost metagenome]
MYSESLSPLAPNSKINGFSAYNKASSKLILELSPVLTPARYSNIAVKAEKVALKITAANP